MIIPFVYLPFIYPIIHPNDFQCSSLGWIMCTANYISDFTTSGPTLVVYHINCTTNDLYYLYLEAPMTHSYL